MKLKIKLVFSGNYLDDLIALTRLVFSGQLFYVKFLSDV